MKAGLATSATLHAVLLGVGLFSLSAPRAFDVADVEALPVDIVPIDSFTQIQEGDRQAPVEDRPAPTPTERPEAVEDAQEVGEADTDMTTPPTPEPTPRPVEQATEQAVAEIPEPLPVPEPEEAEQAPAEEEVPVPSAEREPEPQAPQEMEPDPAPDSMVAENAEGETIDLPPSAPVPQSRPQPPQPQTAKAPRQEEAEEPAARQQAQAESDEPRDNELLDEVAALLNEQEASGGGARRSDEQASLGGQHTNEGQTLTQSEMDALRGQIQRCWNVPAGVLDAENLKVSLRFRLDPSGSVEGNPEIIDGGSGSTVERAAAQSALRAVLRCAPYNLPADKYGAWADVIVHFDPTDMF